MDGVKEAVVKAEEERQAALQVAATKQEAHLAACKLAVMTATARTLKSGYAALGCCKQE